MTALSYVNSRGDIAAKNPGVVSREWNSWMVTFRNSNSEQWVSATSEIPNMTKSNVVELAKQTSVGNPSTSSSIPEPTTSPETTSTSEIASTSSESLTSSSSNTQLKRKVIVYELELKDPSFSLPTLPSDSNIHVEFEAFQSKSKAIALTTNSTLNFAFRKTEALALNGIWFVGKALLDSSEAKEITRTMRQEYHIPDFKEISDLTPLIECILHGESEVDIYEAFNSIASEQTSSRARRALNVWRQLADTLPSEYTPGLHDGELAFRNISLQPFLSVTFSARRSYTVKGDIEHESANEQKAEHKNGVRMWGCQVFGYDITFYVMDMRIPSIYCLMNIFKGTLPKSIEDVSGVTRIISAFFTVEEFIANWIATLDIPNMVTLSPNSHLQPQPNQIAPRVAPRAAKKNKTQPLIVQES
ncbi:hypothetical protein BGZ76_005965 [Entomortierella beljakovae]|nr:hypothetical protein BGZ76_005965 [Entomortierella beljakovae]